MPVLPDPSIPGLLDLLTVQALGVHDGHAPDMPDSTQRSSPTPGSSPTVADTPRPARSDHAVPAGDHASRRLWVEVEV